MTGPATDGSSNTPPADPADGADAGPGDFAFARQGRSRAATLILAAIYAVLIAALLFLQAAPWLVALLALPTLPALYDLLADPRSGLEITAPGPATSPAPRPATGETARLRWFTGRRGGALPLARIRAARFDTRFDLSVRVTLILDDGTRLRLPPPCLPPHRRLEAALKARGVAVIRQHFRRR